MRPVQTVLSDRKPVGLLATDNPAEHPLNQVHEYTTKGASYPYGCHIVELEVDMATLQPKILRYTVVDDIGNIINPLTFAGQIHGGIAQGVGQALYEYVAFDEDGQLLAGSLMDYTLPRADHLPSFSINTRNTVCQNNVLGVKGVGRQRQLVHRLRLFLLYVTRWILCILKCRPPCRLSGR